MSSSSSAAPSRSHGRGGSSSRNSNQKRFVPRGGGGSSHGRSSAADPPVRGDSREPSDSRLRLTTPLRSQPPSVHRAAEVGKGDGRVAFMNYLPQDEAVASGIGVDNGGLDAVESQMVVDILNEGLSTLLKLGPRDFWREVVGNETLHEFLDSYLHFRNRWYDLPHRGARDIIAGIIVGESELSRRVFMTFYRMSSNKDPDAHARDCLSAKEHAALMQEKKLLDLPKLLDICGIYGHENEELTRKLVNNAIKVQPNLVGDMTNTCNYFLGIASTMHQRCISSLQVLVSSECRENPGQNHFHAELLEVMDFINDAIATLGAFVDAYKPSAIWFSCPAEASRGNEELLGFLRRLHDSLLPSLHEGFELFPCNEDGRRLESIDQGLKLLSSRIVKFGWKLLEICYLSDESLNDEFLPQFLQHSTKMFPAQIDDPAIRGDVLMQTFRGINEEIDIHHKKIEGIGTFLQNIEKNFYMLSRIDSLRTTGWMFLDDNQFHCISQMATSLSSNVREKDQKAPTSLVNTQLAFDEDNAIMESKISQIKDLFPDYGKGFLSACLDVYNQNPEEVIQRILEGTLHEDLLSLDTSLEQMPPPKTATNQTSSKGKGVLLDSEIGIRKDKGKALLLEAPTQVVMPSSLVQSSNVESSSLSTFSSSGRYTRKSNREPSDNEVLDSKVDKDSVRATILAAAGQDEYEDEYDDSFDDLGLSVVESGTEVEKFGDGADYAPGPSSLQDQSSNNNSRWSQKKTQFYVKDGKNYSYKVSGSVAVSNAQEAAIVNQAQKEMIHGLGRGGNIALGAVKKLTDTDGEVQQNADVLAGRGRGNSNSRGRGGRRGGQFHQKDRAMKKHFSGLSGS